MKTKQKNVQIAFLTFTILGLVFPLVSIILQTLDIQPNKYMEVNMSDKLHASPLVALDPDEWEETHGYANDYIDWSFSTSPSQVINVWVLDSANYVQFTTSGIASGHHLTKSSSGSGRFDVSSYLGQTWYVIFWNDELVSQTTVLTYDAFFRDDTVPFSITVTEPTSASTYVRDRDYVVKWTSYTPLIGHDYVKIELFKGASLYSSLLTTPTTPNDGEHLVHIPSSCPEASDYRIKIYTSSTVFGFSANFTIQKYTYCRIISPAFQDVFDIGDVIPITWETNCNDSLEVEIELLTFYDWDYLFYIDRNAPNTGIYNWTINAEDLPEDERTYTRFFIYVRPKGYDANCTFGGFFTIQKPFSIPSYNIPIISSMLICAIIVVIKFSKKKIQIY